jgi:hypothetical protein
VLPVATAPVTPFFLHSLGLTNNVFKNVTAVVGEALLYTFTLKIKTCFAQQLEINTWNNIHIF